MIVRRSNDGPTAIGLTDRRNPGGRAAASAAGRDREVGVGDVQQD